MLLPQSEKRNVSFNRRLRINTIKETFQIDLQHFRKSVTYEIIHRTPIYPHLQTYTTYHPPAKPLYNNHQCRVTSGSTERNGERITLQRGHVREASG